MFREIELEINKRREEVGYNPNKLNANKYELTECETSISSDLP